jgi:hypothetical protein
MGHGELLVRRYTRREVMGPLAVKCPRCAVESVHNSKDLLALRAFCTNCNFKLDDIGERLGAQSDENLAFVTWAKVSMGVEDSLGIKSPGIPDGDALARRPLSALTLRDLVRLVQEYVPAGPDSAATAQRLVLEAAEGVAAQRVAESELDRPLLQALRLPHWAEKHGRTNR